MSDQKKTHSLSIYLIKDSLRNEDILKSDELDSKEISGIGTFYFEQKNDKNPPWISLFEGFDIPRLFSKSASALLVIEVENRCFAIPFGHGGRHFLKKGVWEERFGLLVTLNSVHPESLRSIDTKTLEAEGIQTRIQSSRPNSADTFGLDIERDLVRSVTGKSKDETRYGKELSGKDALRVSLKCDLSDLKGFLKNFLDRFQSEEYKSQPSLSWIDKLKEITDLERISELNGKLLNAINNTAEPDTKLWLTVPEILDWQDHGGFKYSQSTKDKELLEDIHIDTFKETLGDSDVALDDLLTKYVCRFSQSNEYERDHWRVYDCIYFENSSENSTYFLTGGKWYEVQESLVETVNTYYETQISNDNFGIDFIDFNHDDEEAYNNALASENNAISVDKGLIQIEGVSKFEFCDVYTADKQMVHIKRYSRSSVLSHLFNQGYVSANFLLDREYRIKINDKLSSRFKIQDLDKRPNENVGEYTVIFGVVSKSSNAFELPFFSKLTLMHVHKSLRNLGFQCSIVQIMNVKPTKKTIS